MAKDDHNHGERLDDGGGKMAGAMHRGLTSEGVSGWLAAVAVGTALQAVFLNQNAPEDESGS